MKPIIVVTKPHFRDSKSNKTVTIDLRRTGVYCKKCYPLQSYFLYKNAGQLPNHKLPVKFRLSLVSRETSNIDAKLKHSCLTDGCVGTKYMKPNRQLESFWPSPVRCFKWNSMEVKLSPLNLVNLACPPVSYYFISLLFSVPTFTLSLCCPHPLSPFLSRLGRHECGWQMAGMFHVSEGSCSSHSPLLPHFQEVSKVGWRVIGNWQGERWHKGCWGQH